MTCAIRFVRIATRTAVLAIALAVLPASASARVVVNERVEIGDAAGGSAFNPCTDEVVAFTEGQIHLVVATEEDQSGGIHYFDHVNFAGVRGVGETTGDEYVVPNSASFSQNATSGASTNTSGQTFQLIRTGSEDDYLLHVRYHLTVTPDGEVAVEFLQLLITCKG